MTTLEHEREVLEQMILAGSDEVLKQSQKLDRLIVEAMEGGVKHEARSKVEAQA